MILVELRYEEENKENHLLDSRYDKERQSNEDLTGISHTLPIQDHSRKNRKSWDRARRVKCQDCLGTAMRDERNVLRKIQYRKAFSR